MKFQIVIWPVLATNLEPSGFKAKINVPSKIDDSVIGYTVNFPGVYATEEDARQQLEQWCDAYVGEPVPATSYIYEASNDHQSE